MPDHGEELTKARMLVFGNVKAVEGQKECSDASKATGKERSSVLNGSKGISRAGTLLETRLLQTNTEQ